MLYIEPLYKFQYYTDWTMKNKGIFLFFYTIIFWYYRIYFCNAFSFRDFIALRFVLIYNQIFLPEHKLLI